MFEELPIIVEKGRSPMSKPSPASSIRQILAFTVASGALLGALLVQPGLQAQEEKQTREETSGPVTVGTYSPDRVAQATGIQQRMMRRMEGLQQRMEAAQQQGDQQAMQEIQVEAQKIQQDVTTEFLADIEAVMPRVAGESGVQIIASGVMYTAPGIATKDVTQSVVDLMTE